MECLSSYKIFTSKKLSAESNKVMLEETWKLGFKQVKGQISTMKRESFTSDMFPKLS